MSKTISDTETTQPITFEGEKKWIDLTDLNREKRPYMHNALRAQNETGHRSGPKPSLDGYDSLPGRGR